MAMLFISSAVLLCQDQDIVFKHVTHKSGLDESEYISAMIQDLKGFVWIAQNNVIQRYDGYVFKDYMLNDAIYNMAEDRRGLIWISTSNGMQLIDPENDRTRHYVQNTPQKLVKTIVEDRDGIIWCATQNGLLKMTLKSDNDEQCRALIFDAGVDSAFIISLLKPNNDDSDEYANSIHEIYEDNLGRLWIGASAGLYLLDKETDAFFRIDDINGQTRLNEPNVVAIKEEAPGILWIRTQAGLSRISNITQDVSGGSINKAEIKIANYRDDRLAVGAGYYSNNRFLISSNNNLWAGGNYGLISVIVDDDQTMAFEYAYKDLNEPEGVDYHEVTSLMEDHTGLIWAGHRSPGIKKFREGNNPITSLEGMFEEYEEAVYDFNQIYKDQHGNLWICTFGSGLFKIAPDGKVNNYRRSAADVQNPIRANSMISLLEMEDGSFYVGTGNGILKFEPNTGTFTDIAPISDAMIFRMLRIGDYIIAFSRASRMAVYDLNTRIFDLYDSGFTGKAVYNAQTNQMELTESNTYDYSAFLSNDMISCNQMQNGEIWITTSLGITRMSIDKETGEITFLPLPEIVSAKYETMFEDETLINRIFEDRQGMLWFCTDKGLVRLDATSGEIRKWTENEGLYSNIVTSIREDQNGNLWMGTSYGLSLLDPVTGKIKTYDDADGLPSVRHTVYCSLIDDEGLIYFGGWGGIYRINPEYSVKNDMAPPIVLTDFSLFNRSVAVDSTRNAILHKNIAYTQEIVLKHDQHDISFTFAALDYNDPSQNKYAYILDGYQEEWIETNADNRIATYTNLSPGKYTFRVKGSNNDGIWNEEGAFVNIIIRPPIWKTALAYVAYGVIFLLLLRGYIFWRTKRLRKEKVVLEKKVAERTQQIEKQKADLTTANTRLIEHEQELQATNIKLRKYQEELQEVNTLLEEQKEELMQQKEELQSILENLQKTQKQLIESEKMAAVGGLVAGVAHEINTPVGVGITAISNLQDEIQRMSGLYEKDEVSRKEFRDFLQSSEDVSKLIRKNLERTADLIQSFKQISTDQVTEQQRVFPLMEYLNDILVSLQPKFSGKNIACKIECNEELKLNSYPGVFAQIFTNLFINSIQHGFHKTDTGLIRIIATKDNGRLKIHYSDDGAGISRKDMPHIFEPFYTSDQHRGTGLGLNIVYNLVKQKLHGTISCESEQGTGTSFIIDVPVH